MPLNAHKLAPDDLIQMLGDLRASHIADEIMGKPFSPARNPLYLQYAFELLRKLLPAAATEKAYTNGLLNHQHDCPDHLICNRAVRMMSQMVDKAFYERFKDSHPKMPKQLTSREWGTYMLQMRFHGWHSGVPVYPSVESGIDAATPLDFITEEQDAMARTSRMPIEILGRDPFDVANQIKGDYPNTSLGALILVVTKAQSQMRVLHVVNSARSGLSPFDFHATIEHAEQGVKATAEKLGFALHDAERESAIQALYLAAAIPSAA